MMSICFSLVHCNLIGVRCGVQPFNPFSPENEPKMMVVLMTHFSLEHNDRLDSTLSDQFLISCKRESPDCEPQMSR